jgi:F-type H+-transporting ATPase subunit epsilon
MATTHLDLVSQDRSVFSGEVNMIIAPGVDGQLGILPRHAPLITVLKPGEVIVRRTNEPDLFFAVSGGWMEVLSSRVTILARTAERSEEIDIMRAEEARASAERLLAQGAPEGEDRSGLEIALRRSQIRLKVAKRHTPHAIRPGEGHPADQD